MWKGEIMKAFKQTDKYSISLGQDKKTITLNLRGYDEVGLNFTEIHQLITDLTRSVFSVEKIKPKCE